MSFFRRYTRWFDNASNIAHYALKNFREWEKQIEAWQCGVLHAPTLPDWYKTALFNELYYLTDGGCVWFSYDDQWKLDEKHLTDYTLNLLKNYGRFAYLECDQIENEDGRTVCFFYKGDRGYVKTKNRIPHDLGSPAEDPWLRVNAYLSHNTAEWKDLNLKFILTSMRDYFILSDSSEKRQFLEHVWPNVKSNRRSARSPDKQLRQVSDIQNISNRRSINAELQKRRRTLADKGSCHTLIHVGLTEWDVDGDSMIENGGTCDQTYDAWRMHGTSSYCGSLWLGALKCAQNMAELLGDYSSEKKYNGYYHFDEGSIDRCAIMADQLCGLWYLCACNIENDLLPEDHVRSSLKKIYEMNFLKFGDGRLGAANGFMPDGSKDTTSMQAEEMWTGVSYALASLMIAKGLDEQGFSLASEAHGSIFGDLGMQFQSPEAIYERKYFRAVGYMRAMAIWAVQWMLERSKFLKQ
uniref:Glycosyl-hydrolase family 116 catalytic region domain-containing protein n=1 Tax=Romanomermis culicivorax TaxID=13658 RepID=A0A915HRB8_ROMCU